jgi:prepilin-type N-terminal cleavage/methylation domain-containing protein
MRTKTNRNLSRASQRFAFTLIELLVVIAIIAALMALSASAVIKYLGSQQGANTQSTLDRTQSQLNKAWSKVKDQAFRETIPSQVDQWIRPNMAQMPSEPPDTTTKRVRVIYVKLKLRQAFPMTFAEALNPAPLPPLAAYQTYLTNLGVAPNTPYGNFESSACLLMALQRGVSGAGVDPSDLTRGGATGNATLPNGNIAFLTDAWGSPIFFSRFPVGSIALNPNGAQPGANDPGDPEGLLQTPNWAQTSGASGPYGTVFTNLTLQQLAPTNSSYKLAPLLASAGPDKTPQFNPITFQPTPGSDDLFSNP